MVEKIKLTYANVLTAVVQVFPPPLLLFWTLFSRRVSGRAVSRNAFEFRCGLASIDEHCASNGFGFSPRVAQHLISLSLSIFLSSLSLFLPLPPPLPYYVSTVGKQGENTTAFNFTEVVVFFPVFRG